MDESATEPDTHVYRAKACSDSLVSYYSNEASSNATGINIEGGIPNRHSLSQNYPNPFNPSTKMKFSLPQSSLRKLTVYDLLGREVWTLMNRELQAGNYEVNFVGSNLANGIYIYSMKAGSFVETRKLSLPE